MADTHIKMWQANFRFILYLYINLIVFYVGWNTSEQERMYMHLWKYIVPRDIISVMNPGWIILICKKMHMKLTFKTNYFISTRKHTETVSRYFDRWCHLCHVFTNIYSLLIYKDSRACRNILIQFPCVSMY